MKVNSEVKDVIEQTIHTTGVSLFDIEYEKVGDDYYLRVLIDHEDGIDLDRCVEVSELLSPVLDEHDFFDHEYFLEVASPGAERTLKTDDHIKDSVGKYIYVKTYAPIDKQKEFLGDLVSFEDHVLTIEYMDKTRKKTVKIDQKDIAKIRLAVKF